MTILDKATENIIKKVDGEVFSLGGLLLMIFFLVAVELGTVYDLPWSITMKENCVTQLDELGRGKDGCVKGETGESM